MAVGSRQLRAPLSRVPVNLSTHLTRSGCHLPTARYASAFCHLTACGVNLPVDFPRTRSTQSHPREEEMRRTLLLLMAVLLTGACTTQPTTTNTAPSPAP